MPDKPLPSEISAAYEKLKQVRASKTVALKPTPMLRSEIKGLDGKPQPLRLRYYQAQGIYHLLLMKRLVLGDGTGLGKTAQVIGTLCYLWPKEPDNKVVVVTPKSALRQWEGEVHRFATGVKTYVVSGGLEARKKVYEAWAKHPATAPDKPVLLVNYHLLVRDWNDGAGVDPKTKKATAGYAHDLFAKLRSVVVVYDEATAFKTPSTKTWQVCAQLSRIAHRCYGLTATLLKNNLMEGFSIYKAIVPDLFSTKTAFMNEYCVTRLMPVGGRSVPLVVGYRNLQHFRDRIDPFFLGRAKHVVSDELPTLITKEIPCELTRAEDAKYSEALTGVFELGDGQVRDYEEHKAFVSLIYCQQVVNSLATLKFEAGAEIETGMFRDEYLKIDKLGSKEQALLDLIVDELDGEKVIVYTRFASLVQRLQHILAEAKIKSARITGKENDKARRASQEAFQNLESDTKVIFITDAGSEAINLQAASAMVFYDAPWSWGNYVQLLGRPIRIGSPHQHIVCYHLVAERPREKKKDRKTIDHHVLALLQSKKHLIDRVLGEAAVGALDFGKGSSTKDLVRKMQGKDADDE
jgi:SNF2 family DNA or RNA helicase